MYAIFIFFFNDPATTEIYTLSLHDALPISTSTEPVTSTGTSVPLTGTWTVSPMRSRPPLTRARAKGRRSEEHTSELQSRQYLVCRLLLEKQKQLCATLTSLYLRLLTTPFIF